MWYQLPIICLFHCSWTRSTGWVLIMGNKPAERYTQPDGSWIRTFNGVAQINWSKQVKFTHSPFRSLKSGHNVLLERRPRKDCSRNRKAPSTYSLLRKSQNAEGSRSYLIVMAVVKNVQKSVFADGCFRKRRTKTVKPRLAVPSCHGSI